MAKFLVLISLLFVAVVAKADPMATDTLWTMHFGVSVQSVVFSPDGQYVYAGAEWRYPRKIDVLTGEIVKEYDFRELNLIKKQYHSLDISADGRYLAVSTGDYPVVSILDEASGEIYRNFVIPQEYINKWQSELYIKSIDLSPDFTNIAICSGGWWNDIEDCRIFIYDIATGELRNTIAGAYFSKIKYSPNGDKLAVIQTWGENAVSYYDTQT